MKFFFTILVLLALPICTPAQIQKIKSFGQDSRNQKSFALQNEVVYFQFNTTQPSPSSDLNSVWVSDGTSNGTRKILSNILIKDQGVQQGDTIFFVTDDSQNNLNLMAYSTSGGLKNLKTIEESSIINNAFVGRNMSNLLIFGNQLFFSIYDGYKNWIWKSDGSVNGTVMLPFDFNSSISYQGMELHPNQNEGLVVSVQTSSDTLQWSYDVTANDTTYLRNFGRIPADHAFLNGIIYFSNSDGPHGSELWRSDGTTAGTYRLTDIDPRVYHDTFNNKTVPLSTYPHKFFVFKGQIYFTIWKNKSNPYDNSVEEIWKTDGTPGGTVQVQPSLSEWSHFDRLTVFPNYFLYTYNDEVHGNEWWISDGTTSGTVLVNDLQQGPASTLNYSNSFTKSNAEIFFSGNDGKIGDELWKFDLATKSIKQLADVVVGTQSSHPTAIQKLGNTLLVIAQDELGDINLFKLDLSTTPSTDPDATPVLPATQWFQTIGYELFLSGFEASAYYNYDMGVDAQNDIYLTGQFNNDKMIFYDNSTIVNLPSFVRNANQISKFDSNGLLKWQRVLHTSNNFTEFYNGPMLAVTADNGVVVASSFSSSAGSPWVNHMGLPAFSNSGLYITRINENGSTLWTKYLLDASFQPYVHAVRTDASGNIYVAGLYFDGLYWQNELLLHYKFTPTYFLLKFGPNGNLIWADDVATQWSDYGKIADVKIDDERARIYLLITEGTRNGWSSCEFQKWHFDLIESDFDGNFIRSKEVESSDLMVASSFDFNSVRDFYIVGHFRGTLTSDGHSLTTPRQGDCSVNRGFIVQLDSAWKAVTIKSGEDEFSDPYEIKFLPDDTYVLSGTNEKDIFIHQYDPLNSLLGKKTVSKDLEITGAAVGAGFTYFNPILRFDNAGNFILSDRYTNDIDSVANDIPGFNLKTFLLKAPFNEIKSVPFVQDDQYPIDFYPNPAKDRLNIKIHEQQARKFRVQIIDALGRLIDTPELNNEQEIYYVDVSRYTRGVYFFVFNNGAKRITRKIIIAH